MNKRRNNHNYYKKINNNISQRENNQNIKKRKYPYGFILFFLISIIKDLYYLSAILLLKLYYQLKIDEITHRGYLLFLALDTFFNGGAIYYIIFSLIKFYDLYSPFNQEWAYIYIWIICSLQLLFLFTSIILFLMKYIYIKLFFISKFKYLFIILCIIQILFNFSSINDLNNDKYSFQIQNFETKKLSNYKEYYKRHYVNLYLNKETDVNEYELCFEMGYPNNFTEILKKEPRYYLWKFEHKKDYFIGCRNISFKDSPSIDKDNPLIFFKCDINNKINILPNYCVSAKIRNKKYNFIYKFNIFQILLLISFFIYGKICHYIFYKYHLYNISKEAYEDLQEKNGDDDGEEGEEEDDGEEGDDEGEEEEDDEEEQEEEEEIEEKINYRRNKYRRISKKKKKYYKKKHRFRKYYFSNNDNQNNQNNNNINDEENKNENNIEENNEKEEKENEGKKEKLINDENQNNNKDNNDEKSNNNNNKKENNNDKIEENNKNNKNNKNQEKNEKNKEIQKDNNNKDNNENDKKENIDDNKKEQQLSYSNNSYKRNGFIYQFLLGGIVDKIKNKFYNILKEIDKDIREDEEN